MSFELENSILVVRDASETVQRLQLVLPFDGWRSCLSRVLAFLDQQHARFIYRDASSIFTLRLISDWATLPPFASRTRKMLVDPGRSVGREAAGGLPWLAR